MDREKAVIETAKVMGVLILFLLGLHTFRSLPLPVDIFADFTSLGNVELWLTAFFLSVDVLLLAYLLSLVGDKRLKYALWAALTVMSLFFTNFTNIDDVLFSSVLLASVFSFGREVRGIGDLWREVRGIKSHGSLLFLLFITLLVWGNATTYNEILLRGLVTAVNDLVPSGQTLTPLVDAMIPNTVTPQEINLLTSYLSQMPEWNLLTPDQRQLLIQQAVQQLQSQKQAIKEAMKQSMATVKVTLDENTVKALLSSDPRLETLSNYLFVFLILGAAAVVSIVLEIASILLFIFLLFPEWMRTKGLPKKKECD